jgi:hypothetical protein
MINSFLANADGAPEVRVSVDISGESSSGAESVRLLVIGSRQGVTKVIHKLHWVNFAEVGSWSRLLPGPKPGEFMSILTLKFV